MRESLFSIMLLCSLAVCAEESMTTESIGTATMLDDGTIVLTLRADSEDGAIIGHGRLTYKPDHSEYNPSL
jgi:hypothetical protein